MSDSWTASECIRQRHTLKVLADERNPWPISQTDFKSVMTDLIELAGFAPFHYPCDPAHQQNGLDSVAPWRFYALDTAASRALLTYVKTLEEPLGKIGSMLAAADGIILATWLPDPPPDPCSVEFQSFAPHKRNMEHIAATSAAIQNLLLAATDRGIPNYWSSGGAVLRTAAVYRQLQMPMNQVLLGAIFLFPRDTRDAETKTGANRGKCGPQTRWVQWV